LETHIRDKKLRYAALAQRALDSLQAVIEDMPEHLPAVESEDA